MPNSAARFRFVGTGGASPDFEFILGLIRLAPRGGSGLVRSGPDIDGCGLLGGDPFGLRPTFDGLRSWASLGAEGLLSEGSSLVLRIGNVFDRCAELSSSRSAKSSVPGAPNPPYPFFLGCLGTTIPDFDPLELFVEVRE